VIRRLPNSCPAWKNLRQDTWYKWSLLKVGERKHKGKHGEAQVEAGSQDSVSALQVLLTPTITYGKGRTRRFPSNN
jgi:hypothetical protein